jgi:hypothetical protein
MKPLPRPASDRPGDLGFSPQPMVQWLAPGELASAALRVVLSGVFGAYADKRELQGVWPVREIPDYGGAEELWLDYVADVADGFDATMSVASTLAREQLDLPLPGADADAPRLHLPRGRVLVMGGDQVYPTADYPTYRDRLIGPYRAALPGVEGDPPDLYAIPGNHDWYDGLTSFLRVFCQGDRIGGWRTRQDRSYFALRLPHGWWFWGIDIQFESYLDPAQLRYFRDTVGARLAPGDSVILASATPSWVDAGTDEPDAYQNLDMIRREIVEPRGAQVRVEIAGDKHHYARYASDDGTQLITSGGGGAYLAATYHLPEAIAVPPEDSRDLHKSPPKPYRLATTYPSRSTSRLMRAGVLSLPFRNGSFWGLVAVTYLVVGWSVLLQLRAPDETFAAMLRGVGWEELLAGLFLRPVGFVMAVLLVAGAAAFNGAPGPKRRWGFGTFHALTHLVLILATTFAAATALAELPDAWYLAALTAALGFVGGLLGSWLVALHLLIADRFGMNTNEVFASQHIEGFNNFVRMHVGRDGALTLHPVSIQDAKRFRFEPEGSDHDPWFVPEDGPPEAGLIERPIRLERLPR